MPSSTQIANVPGTVTVVFARSDNGVLGDRKYTVPVTGVGHAGTHVIHSTAVANFTGGLTPVNSVELATLAAKIAADYYAWKTASLEVRYETISPWTEDGMHDVEYVHGADIFTAVHRSEWEPEFGQLKQSGTYGSSDTVVAPIDTYFGVTLGDVSARRNLRYGQGVVSLLTSESDGLGGYTIVSTGKTLSVLNACDEIPNEYFVEVWREPINNRWMVHPLCEYSLIYASGSGSGLGGGGGDDDGGDENCGDCGPCKAFPCTLCVTTSGVTDGSCTDSDSLPSPLNLARFNDLDDLSCVWLADSGGPVGMAGGPLCGYHYGSTFYYEVGTGRFKWGFFYGALSTVYYQSDVFSPMDSAEMCSEFFNTSGVTFEKISESFPTLTWPATLTIKACATAPPRIYFSDRQICQEANVYVTIVGENFTTPGDTTVTFYPTMTNSVISVTGTSQMVVNITAVPPLGAISAKVTNSNGTSTEVQVAEVVDCTTPPERWWCCSTVAYSDSDFTTAAPSAGFDGIGCIQVPEFANAGDTFSYYTGGVYVLVTALSGPYATETACEAAPCTGSGAVTVAFNNADVCQDAATITITGTGFETTAGNNLVTFETLGAVGTCTSVTGTTSMVVTFSTNPTGFGSLTATVTNANGTSTPAVQVATITDCSGGILWQDTFTGTNGTEITTHTPDISPGGAGYTTLSAQLAFELQSNSLQQIAGNLNPLIGFDPGLTATTATIKITWTSAIISVILAPRNRAEEVAISYSGGINWQINVGGQTQSVTMTEGVTYTLIVEDTGTSITATVADSAGNNGVSVTKSTSLGTSSTVWQLGATMLMDGAITFDNLEVTTP